MKQNLFFWLCLIFTNLLLAQTQGTILIQGATTVEVGVSNSYNISFSPVYPANPSGIQANSFVITQFSMETGTNGIPGSVPGSMASVQNSSSYTSTSDSGTYLFMPIVWSNGSSLDTDVLTVKFSGYYKISYTNEIVSYFNVTASPTINVQRLHTPVTISGPSSITDCSQDNVTFSLSNINAVNGNKYLWSVSNGVIVGSNTGTSVTVQPNLTGSVTASCQVRRVNANQNYYVTGSRRIGRTPFTSTATITGNGTVCSTQTYTVSGLQSGETVVWTLTNNDSEASVAPTTGPTTTVTKTGGGAVTLTATITNSCGSQTVVKTKELIAGPPPPVHWKLGLQEDHRCDIKFHYVPIIFTIPAGCTLTFPYMSPTVSYTSQNIGAEEYLYTFQFQKGYSGYFDFFGKLTNSCGNSIRDVYQEIEIRSCAQLGLGLTATATGTENNFTIYPNPAKEVINIELAANSKEILTTSNISAELFDMMGMKKAVVKLSDFAGKIDTNNLPKGIYVLRINKGNLIESHQIVIE